MALPDYVYVGAKAPEQVLIDLTPSETVPSLAVVTAATVAVTRPDRTTTTWSFAMSNQSATTLRLSHVFDAAGAEVAAKGKYKLLITLATPSGNRRCVPTYLEVRQLS